MTLNDDLWSWQIIIQSALSWILFMRLFNPQLLKTTIQTTRHYEKREVMTKFNLIFLCLNFIEDEILASASTFWLAPLQKGSAWFVNCQLIITFNFNFFKMKTCHLFTENFCEGWFNVTYQKMKSAWIGFRIVLKVHLTAPLVLLHW